jgi:hemerythrin-like domain-containing protein
VDAIDKVAQDHREIAESLAFLEAFLEAFTKGQAPRYAEKARKFYSEYIVEHFRWEEDELFPSVVDKCDAGERKLIEELKNEHPRILSKVAAFSDQVTAWQPEPGRGHVLEITSANTALFQMLMAHARKEERRLFPILRKYVDA